MSAYALAVRTAVPQTTGVPGAVVAAARRQPATPRSADRRADREALRREIERAERRRAQAERVRDNQAARHPLALR